MKQIVPEYKSNNSVYEVLDNNGSWFMVNSIDGYRLKMEHRKVRKERKMIQELRQ